MELFPFVALGIGAACIGTLTLFIVALFLRSRLCSSPNSSSTSPNSTTAGRDGHGSNGNGTANIVTSATHRANTQSTVLGPGYHCNSLEKTGIITPGGIQQPRGAANGCGQNSTPNNGHHHLVSNYARLKQDGVGSNSSLNNSKTNLLANPSNPDVIAGANAYSSTQSLEYHSTGSLTRYNLHNATPTDPYSAIMGGATDPSSDPLHKMMQIEYEQEYGKYAAAYHHSTVAAGGGGGGGGYGVTEEHHVISTLPLTKKMAPPAVPPKPALALFRNSFEPVNKNDYNTIYIRDKILLDSDIPESCV